MASLNTQSIFLFIHIFAALIFVTCANRLVGGFQDIAPTDEGFKNAMNYYISELQKDRPNSYLRLKSIENPAAQVVSGINYRADVVVAYTGCSANDTHPEYCQDVLEQSCAIQVYVVPWLGTAKVTNNSCGVIINIDNTLKREKRGLGGPIEVDPSSPEVQEVAGHAVSALAAKSNSMYSIRLHQVRKVKKQLVAGLLYRMDVDVHLSSCGKVRVSECDSELKEEMSTCHIEIWDQAWRTPRYVLQHYNCSVARNLDTLFYRSRNNNQTPKTSKNLDVGRLKKMSSYSAFQEFKQKFDKQYDAVEEEKRYLIFQENMKTAQFIQDHDLGTATYGATIFADLTPEEFRKNYLSPVWDKSPNPRMAVAEIPKVSIPESYDWRSFNAVTPIKNQGACGSCWAFSVTGNIEGQWAIKKKSLISLSEQELVDCDKLDEGCNGGLPSLAYEEIERLGGLESETDYPYKAEDETCVFNKQEVKVYINGSVNISKNEDDMAAWLYKNGPMSIGINAFAMQFYFGGISHPWHLFCPDALDHGVLIVGYGVKKGYFGNTPYWIIKNSWGEYWGEKGYYLVYRGDGTCGLNEMVSSSIIQ